MTTQTLPKPWVRLDKPTSAPGLEQECNRELAPEHPLYGRVDYAIARCEACDDVLFKLKNDEGFALVHLTWSSTAEPPPSPHTTFLPTFIALESVMGQHAVDHTFDELGIPFPLFAAPVSHASEYAGVGVCELCAMEGHGFRVGIGGYVVVSCPHCSSETGVHVADGNAPCFSCAEPVTLDRRTRGAMIACYGCLRAGKAALTKNTVFGMIRWEEALQGRTYGVPGPEDADNWVKKELPREAMLELLRTPSYSTWQGDSWQLDGDEPMIYIGTWGRAEFDAAAEDGDGQALFRRMVSDPPPSDWVEWLGERAGDHGITVYVFRSRDGAQLAAHYDMD